MEEADYHRVQDLVRRMAGLHLAPSKRRIVAARLAPVMRRSGAPDFTTFIARALADPSRLGALAILEAVTIHSTSFFREPAHFATLRELLPQIADLQDRIVVWSAGCASGEEPYSIAMLAHRLGIPVRVLATDLSAPMIARAAAGTYHARDGRSLPHDMQSLVRSARDGTFQVIPAVRNQVTFVRHNLMADWPMAGPIHIVFCRNVLIYFETNVRQSVIERFADLLHPGALLFVGHADGSLDSDRFERCTSSIYRRVDR